MKELNQHPVIHEQAVAWGDMDAFGHVNNVLYYRYIESARIKYMDILDFFAAEVYTVVASNQCKYLKPVFYPDTLKITASIEEIRTSGFKMTYQIWSTTQNAWVASAEAIMVVVDKNTLKKQAIPDNIKNKIIELETVAGNTPTIFN
ncbi:thioesterase family protein [Acinetobacter soli]|uniref:acyl-CoA thioesterase n=1 Tax=Acinetobacter soli TaxID=487316 RepID=UPI002D808721|nr:thioesterase family protein [Acinetobacter soli]MEB4802315.1 thioesterase family protein [Acinetobacter soli]